MKYEDGLNILRFNEKTGKWYKDNKTGMTVYVLSDKLCEVCGEKFFYCSGNDGNCCSLSCNSIKRNKIYGISKETAKKISNAHLGKITPLEQRKAQSERQKAAGKWSKEKNPAWKGGCDKRKRSEEYGSVEYKSWRSNVYKRDHFTCVMCKTKKSPFNAHHIKRRKDRPDLVFDEHNGVTLCKKCHQNKVTGHEDKFEEMFTKIVESREDNHSRINIIENSPYSV